MQIFGGSMQTLKKEVKNESISQFEITSDLLRNLYKFDLTPVTKLVLLELTTHLNESKNGSVVFPSVGYIAGVLGIGLTAAKKAINDLIKEGIIIKTKRNNVKGNYNKYLLTSKISGLKKGEDRKSRLNSSHRL
jgi:predicted transcriptional regulator